MLFPFFSSSCSASLISMNVQPSEGGFFALHGTLQELCVPKVNFSVFPVTLNVPGYAVLHESVLSL